MLLPSYLATRADERSACRRATAAGLAPAGRGGLPDRDDLVKTAALFNAEIWVRKNGTEVSGRSIMGLMMLAAAPGTAIRLAAIGPDAEAAVTALAKLVECKFDED